MKNPSPGIVLLLAISFGGLSAFSVSKEAYALALIMASLGLFLWFCLKWSKIDREKLTKSETVYFFGMIISCLPILLVALDKMISSLILGEFSSKGASVLIITGIAIYGLRFDIDAVIKVLRTHESKRL